MVTEGVEPSTVALLAQRSNQLSYATSHALSSPIYPKSHIWMLANSYIAYSFMKLFNICLILS